MVHVDKLPFPGMSGASGKGKQICVQTLGELPPSARKDSTNILACAGQDSRDARRLCTLALALDGTGTEQ